LSWRIVLVVEIFGTQTGIGFVIQNYFISQQNDMLLAWTVPVFLLVFAFERVLQRIEKRKFAWREQGEKSPAAGV
jgi:ABC-type nitrate/sulfonate/bicarbonate transport system permease component